MTTAPARSAPPPPPRARANGSEPPQRTRTAVTFTPIPESSGHRIVLFGPGGIGKAQPLEARVLTPTGFVPMGDLRVGDPVIGSDGRPHRVLGVYPQGHRQVFRVTFRDGSATECCEDHLWFTHTVGERDSHLPGSVRCLRSIRRTLRYGRQFNHAVHRVQAVQFAPLAQVLPIDPWLLGMYLGDGVADGSVVIHKPEQDLHGRVAAALHPADSCASVNGAKAVRIKSQQRRQGASAMMKALRQLGLAGRASYEKFVPRDYLHASVEQRLGLLRGLLDSDGHVTNPGAVEFCSTSPRLAEDFCFLVRSLGGSARLRVKQRCAYRHRGQKRFGRTAWRVFASFPADLVPVSSAKHLGKWAPPRWAIHHTIRSVEPVGRKPCQCICVDAPDSLYVTDDFILTHNTTLAATAPGPVAFFDLDDSLPRLKGQLADAQAKLDIRQVGGMRSWQDMRDALHADGWSGIRTIVIDSATRAEELAVEHTLATVPHEKGHRVPRIEDYGFGKGYSHVYDTFLTLLGDLDQHTRAGRNVILICHDCTASVPNPDGDDWIRYEPRLQSPASGKSSIRLRVREWADHVLFVGYDIAVKDGKGTGSGTRTIYPNELPHCMAKSRTLSQPLPLSKFDLTLWNNLFGENHAS